MECQWIPRPFFARIPPFFPIALSLAMAGLLAGPRFASAAGMSPTVEQTEEPVVTRPDDTPPSAETPWWEDTSVTATGTTAAPTHRLAGVATWLASLNDADYNARQKHWAGTIRPACNFFLITALCEDGGCKRSIPMYSATDFAGYLQNRGWETITLAELKSKLRAHADLDVVLQRDGAPSTHGHGHVAVVVGLTRSDELRLAEAELGSFTHALRVMSDDEVVGGRFRILALER